MSLSFRSSGPVAVVALTLITAASAEALPAVLLHPSHVAKSDDDAARLLREVRSRTGVPVRFQRRTLFGWVLANVDVPDQALRAAVTRLAGDKALDAVEPDHWLWATRTPNDPELPALWGFSAIEAEAAWTKTVGLASQRIGLVDTGIRRDHLDLAPRDKGGFDFISDPDNAGDGDGRDDDYSDEGGAGEFHGSHVAGTMLARGNDGVGVPGVNWRAGLVTARALGQNGGGDLVDIMEAAAWLAGFDVDGVPNVGADKVSVINLSLGMDAPCSRFEHDVMSEVIDAGVAVVAASGNTGRNSGTGSPANCPGVIAVGAVDAQLALAVYSSFDDRTDVLAPGGDRSETDAAGILSVDGATLDGYKSLEGTSMAAPHVTGVVSLMQAVNARLSPAQIKTILEQSPYTCGRCEDHAFLQADDAVTRAGEMTGELGTSGPPDTGRPHSHDLDDGTIALCDPARGNWDCVAGAGCVDGLCIDGDEGRGHIGERCVDDTSCASGLCDRGVCTRPCDDAGCPPRMACDAVVIPGGLCRAAVPLSCAATDSEGAVGAVAMLGVAAAFGRRRRTRCE